MKQSSCFARRQKIRGPILRRRHRSPHTPQYRLRSAEFPCFAPGPRPFPSLEPPQLSLRIRLHRVSIDDPLTLDNEALDEPVLNRRDTDRSMQSPSARIEPNIANEMVGRLDAIQFRGFFSVGTQKVGPRVPFEPKRYAEEICTGQLDHKYHPVAKAQSTVGLHLIIVATQSRRSA